MSTAKIVDIIIPVYKGLTDTRRCIQSVLASQNRHPVHLILINDATPEIEVANYLRELGGAFSLDAAPGAVSLTLLENAENLGFVRTVNRGMSFNPTHDVILLNSDTEVSDGWIDRIVECANQDPRIGTVTPFSNNATLASYPRIGEPNELPEGDTTQSLNRLFGETNPSLPVNIPTAVGFCMFIRRECLKDTGLFNVEVFGQGYGEENDFSLRAVKRGWRNVLCPSVFVKHVGGVSFGESQGLRMDLAKKALLKIHPDYEYRVYQHFKADPARPFRLAVDLRRLIKSPYPVILMVSHSMGGGTQKHINELAHLLKGKAEVLLLKPAQQSIRSELSWLSASEGFKLYFTLPGEYPQLRAILSEIGVSRIHFHHLLGLDPVVRSLPSDLGVAYDVTVHDFYVACPRLHLTRVDQHYCGEPEAAGCNQCLKARPRTESQDIMAWREEHRLLMENAARIMAPSEFVASRVKRYFPGAVAMLRVVAHPEPPSSSRVQATQSTLPANPGVLRVVVLGALDEKKGKGVILRCAELAARCKFPLEFHLHGMLIGNANHSNINLLVDHGPYLSDSELETRLSNESNTLILAWFPNQCPETYGYTLSLALRLGLPIVASDIGSYPERLKNRTRTWLMPWQSTAMAWNQRLLEVRALLLSTSVGAAIPKVPQTIVPPSFYESQYLIEKRRLPETSTKLSANALSEFAYSDPRITTPGRRFLGETLISLRYSSALSPISARLPKGLKRWLRSLITGG